MRGLREGRQPEPDGRHEVAARADEPGAARPSCRCRGTRHFLVEPEEVAEGDQAEIEEIGREPHEVDRRHRHEHERQREDQRRRRLAARHEERVGADEARQQHEHVQHEESVGAKEADERRREERIDERLGEVEPRGIGVGLHIHVQERHRAVEPQVRIAAALEEDPFGSARELAPHAHEVLAPELEVAIVGQAVPESVVGGGVGEEAVRRLRIVDRERPGEEHRGERGRGHDAEAPGLRAGAPGVDHGRAPSWRNDRSSVRALCRFVRFDDSCSSS